MMPLMLLEILAKNERIIVWSDESENMIFTWNESATLQAWRKHGTTRDAWDEISIQSLGVEPKNFSEARAAAQRWMANGVNEDYR